MKSIHNSLLASAVALGLVSGAAHGATGIQFDKSGTGSIAGSVFVNDLGGSKGNLLMDNLFPVLSGAGASVPKDGTLYFHNHIVHPFGGSGSFTWQLILPVTSSSITDTGAVGPGGLGEIVKVENRGSSAPANPDDIVGANGAVFALYWDPTPTDGPVVNAQTGTGNGFGDLNGSTKATGAVKVVQGTAAITNGFFFLTQESAGLFDGDGDGKFELANNRDGVAGNQGANSPYVAGAASELGLTTTVKAGGSLSVNVDVLWQNDLYVVNNLVTTTAVVDLILGSLGPLAPFDEGINASATVVGMTADFGNGSNDFACGLAACDMQLQISEALNFAGEKVPEPATIAMLGLGLTVFGAGTAARRRRKG